MDLILYYIPLKLRQVFNPVQNTWGFIGLLSFLLLGLFYGAGIAAIVDGNFLENADIAVEDVQVFLLLLIAGLTFIRGYYPSYRPLQSWFKPFHALSPGQRFLLNYCNDLLATYFFSMASFIIVLVTFSETIRYTFGLQMGFVLLGVHVLRRMLQTVTEHKLYFTRTTRLLLTLPLAVLAMVLVLLLLQSEYQFLLSGLAFAALLAAGFVLEELTRREAIQVHGTGKAGRSYSVDLILQNKSVRVSLLMALVFKSLFLLLDLFFYAKKGSHMFGNFALMWLLVSPAIIFTYVFNNTWGYLRHLWLLADRATADARDLFVLLWGLVKRPLLLDFCITLLYLTFQEDDLFVAGISMYVCCAFLFTVMSLYWSGAHPIYIDKPVSMKANTSKLASVVLLLVTSSLLLLFVSVWFYLLLPLYALAGYWLLLEILKAYPQQRQKLFLKLFKQ